MKRMKRMYTDIFISIPLYLCLDNDEPETRVQVVCFSYSGGTECVPIRTGEERLE